MQQMSCPLAGFGFGQSQNGTRPDHHILQGGQVWEEVESLEDHADFNSVPSVAKRTSSGTCIGQSVPIASTSRLRESSATTVGSLRTRPFPLA